LALPASGRRRARHRRDDGELTCLAAARNWVVGQHGWDVDRQGLFGAPDLTVVVGEEAHATLYKVLSMLGLGATALLRVPVTGRGASAATACRRSRGRRSSSAPRPAT